jgi:nickel-dependent lactate racemase
MQPTAVRDHLFFAEGSPDREFGPGELREALFLTFERMGPRHRVLIIPPDFTRAHSRAGEIVQLAYEYYGSAVAAVLPALGTHSPMTPTQVERMYAGVPSELFRVHDWRRDVVTLGTVPAEYVKEVSGGLVDYPFPAQVNRLLVEGGFDLILSVGQIVPHEVMGMANYTKNILIGTGGSEGINKSHFLGAAYGMERIMGRADTPVRRVLNYAMHQFAAQLPVVYVHTVIGRKEEGALALRGLYVGDGERSFTMPAELSLKVNFRMLDRPIGKCVVYLDPGEYKSTWLGNKAIYRTRMAMADGGELVVMAPGVREFGEDRTVDGLIRKYGYHGTPATLKAVAENADLAANLGAAAHLIHGSTEGRFGVTYAPGHLSRQEIEEAGYTYADLGATMDRYDPSRLKDGYNLLANGEEVFYVSNPALGLWAHEARFAR